MGLLDRICEGIQCEYLSDMRSETNLTAARAVAASLDLDPYTLPELRDAARYLYGGEYADLGREAVTAVLRGDPSERPKHLWEEDDLLR